MLKLQEMPCFVMEIIVVVVVIKMTYCREHIDYFMESARVRYLRTSCLRISKRTSEFLIQKQRVRKYRTKHFPCCNLFIPYLLHSKVTKGR